MYRLLRLRGEPLPLGQPLPRVPGLADYGGHHHQLQAVPLLAQGVEGDAEKKTQESEFEAMTEPLTPEQRHLEAIGRCGGQGQLCDKCTIAVIRAVTIATFREAASIAYLQFEHYDIEQALRARADELERQ